MPWILFEAVLAAPKQTVGLAKTHLRQEGRLQRSSAAADHCSSSSPLRPQPTEKAPGPGRPCCCKTLLLRALSVLSELFGSLIERNKHPRG